MHVLNLGPNAQAVIDGLKDRPASVIARCADDVQATFRALFSGAHTPAKLAGSILFCGHEDATRGWPGCWDELMRLGLIAYLIKAPAPSTLQISNDREQYVHWVITGQGWTVRMDDVAWMVEFQAATEADKATKQ